MTDQENGLLCQLCQLLRADHVGEEPTTSSDGRRMFRVTWRRDIDGRTVRARIRRVLGKRLEDLEIRRHARGVEATLIVQWPTIAQPAATPEQGEGLDAKV